jgi:hypothetical protein
MKKVNVPQTRSSNFTFTCPVHHRGRKSGTLPNSHAENAGTKTVKPRKMSPASQMTPRSSDIPPPEAAATRALKIPEDLSLLGL